MRLEQYRDARARDRRLRRARPWLGPQETDLADVHIKRVRVCCAAGAVLAALALRVGRRLVRLYHENLGPEARLRPLGDDPAPLGVHVRAGVEPAAPAPARRLRLGLARARVHAALARVRATPSFWCENKNGCGNEVLVCQNEPYV